MVRSTESTLFILSRPSSPISALLEYKYGQRWLEEQQARDRALLDHQNKKVNSWDMSSGGMTVYNDKDISNTVTCISIHTS